MTNRTHRSSKLERAEALRVLKAIWEKGYFEGVTLEYKETEEAECNKVFFSLADYRRRINKNKVKEFDIFIKIQSTTLQRISPLVIKLSRKPNEKTPTARAILSVADRFPELGINPHSNSVDPVHEILAGMKRDI